MFVWDRHTVQIAVVLAKAGYSSQETATILGISRSAVLGRSNRKREFQFKTPCRGVQLAEEARAIRLEAARELIKDVIPPAEPHQPIEFVSKKTRERIAAFKARKNPKVIIRRDPLTEKPLTEEEKRLLFTVEGGNPNSVKFLDLKEKHCRWIVSEVDGIDTVFCGNKHIEGSQYCEHHRVRSIRQHQPKRLNYKKVLLLDQNIVHVAPTMEKNTSALKKS
jgi:hypothetical protein